MKSRKQRQEKVRSLAQHYSGSDESVVSLSQQERRKALLASIASNPHQIPSAAAPVNLIREDRDR